MVERTSGDEELGSVGVLSGVGHGEETRLGVLQLEVFVWIGEPIQENRIRPDIRARNVPANFSP